MKTFRAFKTELDPNLKQRKLLERYAGVARWAYNWGLGRRIAEYKAEKKSNSFFQQFRELNALKKTPEHAWLYEISKCVPQVALKNLHTAYQNFFRNLKAGRKGKIFPHFKSRRRGIGSFTLDGCIHIFDNSVQLPRLGVIKLKERGYIPTRDFKILSATCSEQAGRWFVSVQGEFEIPNPIPATGEPMGVDVGVKSLAVCSDGRVFENPKALASAKKRMRRLQQEMSRRKKGSKNREKTRQKVARLHYRIANLRKDSLHQTTTAIIKHEPRPSTVIIEDLNVKGMMKSHCLARAISDAGIAELHRQLKYKAKWNGLGLAIAPRMFPSSKMCHVCGRINENLTLSNRKWKCECGMELDRDLNAAMNLKGLAYPRIEGNDDACGESIRPKATSAALVEAGTARICGD